MMQWTEMEVSRTPSKQSIQNPTTGLHLNTTTDTKPEPLTVTVTLKTLVTPRHTSNTTIHRYTVNHHIHYYSLSIIST